MIPFRFGSPDHRLFAAYHPPQKNQPARLAVLLCNPFGQEAVRLHRFYKVLADRLTRSGLAVLRFDYFGTGESDGDDLDGHLDIWRQNVLSAHQELLRRSGCNRVAWIGSRLGATVALQAASTATPAPDRLILWEPIIDGPAYLAQLAKDHVNNITRTGQTAVQAAGLKPRGEALGFGMSDALVAQIDSLAPARVSVSTPAQTTIVLGQPDDQALHGFATAGAWATSAQRAVRYQPLQVPFDWTSEEALNTALVPPAALKAITSVFEESSQ